MTADRCVASMPVAMLALFVGFVLAVYGYRFLPVLFPAWGFFGSPAAPSGCRPFLTKVRFPPSPAGFFFAVVSGVPLSLFSSCAVR